MRRGACAAVLAAAGLVMARMVGAQGGNPERAPEIRTLLLQPPARAGARAQRPIPPLDAAAIAELQRARGFRDTGLYDRGRAVLTELLAKTPHHPLVLDELAGLYLEQESWRSIETLARAERAATRDSLLLAPELVHALEQQKHHREAAQVALEAWTASPGEWEWAGPALDRLAGFDPRAVRELVRRAVERRPRRFDLLRAAARLEYRHGAPTDAIELLSRADQVPGISLRWAFADELLQSSVTRDSLGAIASLVNLAGDDRRELRDRLLGARRAWQLHGRRGTQAAGAAQVAQALRNVPSERWDRDVLLPVVRALRQGGQTGQARELIGGLGGEPGAVPEVALERALNELREGPPERALAGLETLALTLPEATFYLAEGRFFAGHVDSALAAYQRIATTPQGTYTGAALERIYLIEDGTPKEALPLFGRLAYERWRGEAKRAVVLAESLYRSLPHTPLWAVAALELSALQDGLGDPKAALEPLLAVAETSSQDRLASLARQRAGDLYRLRLKDDAKALEQYEECLARYPKAWNAPEVRRQVEILRRERRF
ncbi:MAG TPA: hypothetical protein VEY91_08120 [Candidatus Limnocylindria bacterium]|nr:hypothetical protein [Candidatus Limnocylindria bacterium]